MPFRLSVLASLTASALGLPVLAQEAPRICGAAQVTWLAENEAGQDISASEAALSAPVRVIGNQAAVLAFRNTA